MRRDLILLGVTVLATLFALELATRWLLRDITTTGDNTSYFGERWRASGNVRLNRLAFRDDDFAPEPSPGVFRITAIGDSITYGQGIDEDARFTERLEERLNAAGSLEFEVINFGVPGGGYERHRETLALALERAKPDFVLLQWHRNDLRDPEVRPPRAWRLAWYAHRYLHPHSALYFLAHDAFTRGQYALNLVPPADDYYVKHFHDPNGPVAVDARRRLEEVLDLARAHGLPLAMVLWPTPRTGSADFASQDFLVAQVLDVCQDRGLACLDLGPALAAEGGGSLRVNRFDGHPNAYANRLAADTIVEMLEGLWFEAAKKKRPRQGHVISSEAL